ncbi:FAD/NAD(P)-binding domain-containing protein [Aspergillus lentulus]|nr:FAD/NAD(P)-binding domain-containing protein [Aspergillus lentulus]GFF98399.1 FAD/NAD(P)-binding domain-containing protein [Aspergillus lentulus]
MVLHSDPPFTTDFDQSWPASSFIVTSWDRSNKNRPRDPSALQALRSLPAIQNKRGLSFCFSWTGRGFLEDAVTSGFAVAVELLGAKVPFAFEHHPDLLDATDLPQLNLTLTDHLIRTLLSLLRFYVLVIEVSLILLGALRGLLKNKICLPGK